MVVSTLAYGLMMLLRRITSLMSPSPVSSGLIKPSLACLTSLGTLFRWIALDLAPVAVVVTLGRFNIVVVIVITSLMTGQYAEKTDLACVAWRGIRRGQCNHFWFRLIGSDPIGGSFMVIDTHIHIIVPEITLEAAPEKHGDPVLQRENGEANRVIVERRMGSVLRPYSDIEKILVEQDMAGVDRVLLSPWSALFKI